MRNTTMLCEAAYGAFEAMRQLMRPSESVEAGKITKVCEAEDPAEFRRRLISYREAHCARSLVVASNTSAEMGAILSERLTHAAGLGDLRGLIEDAMPNRIRDHGPSDMAFMDRHLDEGRIHMQLQHLRVQFASEATAEFHRRQTASDAASHSLFRELMAELEAMDPYDHPLPCITLGFALEATARVAMRPEITGIIPDDDCVRAIASCAAASLALSEAAILAMAAPAPDIDENGAGNDLRLIS